MPTRTSSMGFVALAAFLASLGTVHASGYWETCGFEHEECYCLGTIRYGVPGSWASHVISSNGRSPVSCTNEFFGDPIYGTVKKCECTANHKVPVFEDCASENGVCECDGIVRYGSDDTPATWNYQTPWPGQWNYQSNYGRQTIKCISSSLGGDPAPGVLKKCQCLPYRAGTMAEPGFSYQYVGNVGDPSVPANFNVMRYGTERDWTEYKTNADRVPCGKEGENLRNQCWVRGNLRADWNDLDV